MFVSKRLLFIYVSIAVLVLALSQCSDFKSKKAADIRGLAYADPQSCANCHKNLERSFSETSHFHTSAEMNELSKELPHADSSYWFNDSLKVIVTKRKKRMYQATWYGNKEIESHRFDIAIGSGEKARSYAYWNEDQLFQLPLTYYRSLNKWTNSPGFPVGEADYKRAIVSRCFECHSSFAKTRISKTGSLSVSETVVKGSVLYGIDCQRCHGPAAAHVAFHQKNPEEKTARHITAIRSLSRQQKVDMCAVCHSGNDQATQQATFAFKPGDTLSNYYFPQYSHSGKEPDVHGNQYGMLARSACFIKSQMDCSSCHNTHLNEKNDSALFTQRCLSCHDTATHPSSAMLSKKAISSNCIDCHMPVQPSKLISFQLAGKNTKTPYLLRSHRIAVYPEETKKILSYLKSR